MNNQPIACPKCHENNRVRKVSGVHNDSRLAPPPKPVFNDPSPRINSAALVIMALLFFFGGWMFLGLLATEVQGGWWMCYGLLLIIAIVMGVITNQAKKKERESLDVRMSEWNRLMGKWEELYYCELDDIVFNPHDGTSTSANNIRTYVESRGR